MSGNGRHIALIVEDDPLIADILKELVSSLDHEWCHAATLEEVRTELAAGGYCYALLDMQIPADATSQATVGCGETALRAIRKKAPERNQRDKHLLPILVVTGYSRDVDFVSKMYKEGADDFIAKPFGARLDLVLDKIRDALRLAEREEHEACRAVLALDARVANAPDVPAEPQGPAPGSIVRITIDGTHLAMRNDVIVNGVRGSLPDSHFVVLLCAVGVHLKTPGEWESATKLGMVRNRWAPSRIVSALKELLPAGFRVIEANKPHAYRLNPAIVVERVEWAALAKHPQGGVRKVAGEFGKG